MLISYNWLQQYIPNLNTSADNIAEALTLSLAEVEDVRAVGNDIVFEIENKALSHRPDLFSQLGMAREVAAALNKRLGQKPHQNSKEQEGLLFPAPTEAKFEINLDVQDETLCPRYMAVVINNLRVGESPNWIQERLRSLNQRPINNIVDITNYVMHEIGQPVHAFDAQKLETLAHKHLASSDAGGQNSRFKIGVRQAQPGEKLTTIDKVERNFGGGEVVITSNKHPIALAGIMGGAETQVSNQTTTILLEAANFNMYSVRKTSKELGLRTEASLRFEKGLDPNLAREGVHRCIKLLEEIAGGRVASKVADFYPTPLEPLEIELNLGKVREFLGVDLSKEQLVEYWERLGLQVWLHNKEDKEPFFVNTATITIPTFRRDLTIPEDLYEEVARLHGYNNFEPTLPARTIEPPLENREWAFAQRIRDVLAGFGLDEILTYSFIDPKIAQQTQNKPNRFKGLPLKLQNPVAPEMSFLRTSLLPSIGDKVVKNAKRLDEFGVFEIGKVTRVNPKAKTQTPKHAGQAASRGILSSEPQAQNASEENGLPSEPKMLALAYYSQNKSKEHVYLHTKGILETLLTTLNIQPLTFNTQPEILNPQDLKPFSGTAYGWEIELATLQELSAPVEFTAIPAHMPTYQDLSFVIDENVAVGEILKIISDVGADTPSLLQTVKLIDVYQSNQMRQQNQKSITVRLEFLDPKGPLSDKNVNPLRKQIEELLQKKFNAQIR